MRLYSFTSMYISSIQSGIQTAHCVSDMFVKYQLQSAATVPMLFDWARHHKTIVVLNGGFSETIKELTAFMQNQDNPYPWVEFFESKEALDGIQTSVSIVLPDRIYDTKKKAKVVPGLRYRDIIPDLSDWEEELINRLSEFKLAN